MPITVGVVDDHQAIAQLLELSFEKQPDLVASWTRPTVAAAKAAVHAQSPDVIVLDFRLPDGSAVDLLTWLATKQQPPRAVVFSGLASSPSVAECLWAGAHAFVDKTDGLHILHTAIRRAAQGRRFVTAHVKEMLLAECPDDGRASSLTDRDREILQMLTDGFTAGMVARRLGLSVHTVRNQIADVRHKLGADSSVQAVVEAIRRGVVTI